jgi:hypothetical protein
LWRAVAWIDVRVWCHPKFTGLSGNAGWAWVKGLAYSVGFGTKGHLTREQQKLVGGVGGVRRELIAAGLWDELPDGSIVVHDWDDYNDRRDAKRKRDRDRIAAKRAAEKSDMSRDSRATVAPEVAPVSRGDSSEGSEVKRTALKAVPADDEKTLEVRKLLRHLKDTDEGTEGVLLSYARRLPLASVAKVRESCETRRVGAGYAVSALQSELAEIAEQNGG